MKEEKQEKPAETKKNQAQEPVEEEKQKLLQMSEISLILDCYDDIFSDFDPRPFSQRALSDDFLVEAKKASKDKVSGEIELKFLIPTAKRSASQEALIKKRLREHFSKHLGILKEEGAGLIKKGLLFVMAGIILMFIATLIMFKLSKNDIWTNFLIILLEPGGWFLFWEGLNQAIFKSKDISPEMEFYEKMAKCEITFLSY